MNPYREALTGWDAEHWCKVATQTDDGKRCLLGRWCQVGQSQHDIGLLAETIAEQYPDRLIPIENPIPVFVVTYFNDRVDTTFGDVTAVLEKAAVRWDEQQ